MDKKKFNVDGKIAEVPADRAEAFIAKYPNAVEQPLSSNQDSQPTKQTGMVNFDVDGRKASVPADREQSFRMKYPTAKLVVDTPVEEEKPGLWDKIVNKVKGSDIANVIASTPEADPNTTVTGVDAIKQGFDQMVQGWKSQAAETVRKGIIGQPIGAGYAPLPNLDKEQVQKGADVIIEDVSQQLAEHKAPATEADKFLMLLPQAVGGLASIGAGLVSGGAGFAVGGTNMLAMSATASGLAMNEARSYANEKGIEISDEKIALTGLLSAGIEMATEAIPLSRYLGRVTNFGNTPNFISKALSKRTTQNLVENPTAQRELSTLVSKLPSSAKRKINTLTTLGVDMIAEGGSEALAEGMQTLQKVIYQNPEDYPTLKEILDASYEGAKGGIFLAGILGPSSRMASLYQNNKRREQAGEVNLIGTDKGVFEVIELDDESNTFIALDSKGDLVDINGDDVIDYASMPTSEFKAYAKKQTKSNLDNLEQQAYYANYNVFSPTAEGLDPEIDPVALERSQDNIRKLSRSMYRAKTQLKPEEVALLDELSSNEYADLLELATGLDNSFSEAAQAHNVSIPAEDAFLASLTDSDKIDKVANYFNARSSLNGAINAVNDRVATISEVRNQFVDRLTDIDGNITKIATLDGNEVYVSSGDLVFNEEGRIDRNLSDDKVIVRDEDGNVGMIPATDISSLVFKQEANAYKEEQAAAIKEIYGLGHDALASNLGNLPIGATVQVDTPAGLQSVVVQNIYDDIDGSPVIDVALEDGTTYTVPANEINPQDNVLAQGEIFPFFDGTSAAKMEIISPYMENENMYEVLITRQGEPSTIANFTPEDIASLREAHNEYINELSSGISNVSPDQDVVPAQGDKYMINGGNETIEIISPINSDNQYEVATFNSAGENTSINAYTAEEINALRRSAIQQPEVEDVQVESTEAEQPVEGQPAQEQETQEAQEAEPTTEEQSEQEAEPTSIGDTPLRVYGYENLANDLERDGVSYNDAMQYANGIVDSILAEIKTIDKQLAAGPKKGQNITDFTNNKKDLRARSIDAYEELEAWRNLRVELYMRNEAAPWDDREIIAQRQAAETTQSAQQQQKTGRSYSQRLDTLLASYGMGRSDLSTRGKVWYDIASGVKFLWKDKVSSQGVVTSRGLRSSLLGNDKAKMAEEFNFATNKESDGVTVEAYTESLWFDVAPDDADVYTDIANEVLDALASVSTRKEAYDSVVSEVEIRKEVQEDYSDMESEQQLLFDVQQRRESERSLEQGAPQAVEITPLSEEAVLQVDEVAPPGEEISPLSEEAVLQVDEVAPLAEEVAPLAEEVAPPGEEVAPLAEEVAPPAEEVVLPVEEIDLFTNYNDNDEQTSETGDAIATSKEVSTDTSGTSTDTSQSDDAGSAIIPTERSTSQSDRGSEAASFISEAEDEQRDDRGSDTSSTRGELYSSEQPTRDSDGGVGDQSDTQQPDRNGRNYAIDGPVHPRGNAAKIKANIEAIKLAKRLDASGKLATPNQMTTLAKYTGWGGLSAVFKESDPNYNALKEVLTKEEYASARKSTTTSFYTPIPVINKLWDIATKLGVSGGSILEPSAGIGHIIGAMPRTISANSDIRSIELDNISGTILKLLYPDSKVSIGGFEEQTIKPNSQSLVITNVPFASVKVFDSKHKDISSKFNIHDYFIAKSLRSLKPGGVGVFITTSSTLDKSTSLRNWVVNEGNSDFIGAVRLNDNTFVGNAGTAATSDIIIIRKRDDNGKSPYAVDMQDVVVEREAKYPTQSGEETARMSYNQYFAENPDNLAGIMRFGFEGGNAMRPTEQRLAEVSSVNQMAVIDKFIESLPENISSAPTKIEETTAEIESDGTKEGGMTVIDDNVYIIENGEPTKVSWNSSKVAGKYPKEQVAKDYLKLKQAINSQLDAENTNTSNDEIESRRKHLNKVYDEFVENYGTLTNNKKITFLRDDIDYPTVSAIENTALLTDADGKRTTEVSKSDIFSKRVLQPITERKVESYSDAISSSLFINGRIDMPYIAKSLNKPLNEVTESMVNDGLIFENPDTGLYEDRNTYLSGNVKEKLEKATAAGYEANIAALQEVIPMDVSIDEIKVALGSTWIPMEVYDAYFLEAFDVKTKFRKTKTDKFVANVPKRALVGKDMDKGVNSVGGSTIALNSMNNTATVLMKSVYVNGRSQKIKDIEATAQAASKLEAISQDFEQWVKSDANPMQAEMVKIYNDTYNAVVETKGEDVDFDYFPGASRTKKPRDHQKAAVKRALKQSTLFAHEVGTGKTITLISTAMEMRRLGLAKKPCIVVQKATFGQFASEIKELYPNAKVLVPSEKDMTAENRQKLYAKIAYNDWDIVVLYHSFLDKIPDSQERIDAYIREQIQEKLDVIDQLESMDDANTNRMASGLRKQIKALEDSLEANGKSRSVKQEESAKAKAETKAKKSLDRQTDATYEFEQLGIDALLVDEAHNYKKLGFHTSLQNIKGIDTSLSKRAQSMRLKTQYIQERNGGRNVVFATGTPISNTMAEMWTFIRYLTPRAELDRLGIANFDAFVNNFGQIFESYEFGTSGKYKATNRFAAYTNLPELLQIWKQVADVVLTEEVSTLKEGVGTPYVKNGKPTDLMIEQTPVLKAIMKSVRADLEAYDKMRGEEKKKNAHIPITRFTIAKRAAIDARLINPMLPDDPNSKTNVAVEAIFNDLAETADYKGTIAVFCDAYQSSDETFNIFEDMKAKLIAKGVPAQQIAIINDYKTDVAKHNLFTDVNAGDVRVVMGTTEKLGVGVNIQTKLHMAVHMDVPMRPSDYQQRNGRIIRQGNSHLAMNKPVEILRIGVKKTLDVTGYQRLETKKRFIDQIMKGDTTSRVMEESDETDANNFGAMTATLSGSESALALQVESSKLKRLEQDQMFYEQDLARKEHNIDIYKQTIISSKAQIDKFEGIIESINTEFPAKKITTIQLGKRTLELNAPIDESRIDVDKFFKDNINKAIVQEAANLKSDKTSSSKALSLNLLVNDKVFAFKVVLYKQYQNSSFNDEAVIISREIEYNSPNIAVLKGSARSSIFNALVSLDTLISTSPWQENIAKVKAEIAERERYITTFEPRIGQPWPKLEQYTTQLAKVAELDAKMKKEIEILEAELKAEEAAEQAEVVDISETFEEEEVVYRKEQTVDNYTDVNEVIDVVSQLSADLGIDINVVNTAQIDPSDPLVNEIKEAKGYYDIRNDVVTVVVDNADSVDDAIATVLHEVVAHKGLRDLYGRDFTKMLGDVYARLDNVERAKIRKMAKDNSISIGRATEEYIAEVAEQGIISPSFYRNVIDTIVDAFKSFMSKLGYDFNLTEYDIKRMLWESYNHLKGRNIADTARISSKAAKLDEIHELDNIDVNSPLYEVAVGDISIDELVANNQSDAVYRRRSSSDDIVVDTFVNASQAYEKELTKKRYKANEAHRDYAASLKVMQSAIAQESGRQIADFENVDLANNQLSSINTAHMQHYKATYFDPILNTVGQIIAKERGTRGLKKTKAVSQELYTYVQHYIFAKSGLERNQVFAQREFDKALKTFDKKEFDAKLARHSRSVANNRYESQEAADKALEKIMKTEPTLAKYTRDYAGLKALAASSNVDVKEFTSNAEAIVAEFENKYNAESLRLWAQLKAANDATLDHALSSGMIDVKTRDNLSNMMEYYVPLRGFDETLASDIYSYTTSNVGDYNALLVKAKGRTSLADDPIATIASIADTSIMANNRNKVKQRLYALAVNHSSPLISSREVWFALQQDGVNDDGTPKMIYREMMPNIPDNSTPEQVAAILSSFDAEMRVMEAENKAYRKSSGKLAIGVRTTTQQAKEHTVKLKMNGRDYNVFVNGNPRVAQVLNGRFKQTSVGGDVEILQWINRQLSANVTMRNPDFILSNASRDIQQGLETTFIKHGRSYAAAYLKNLPLAIAAVKRGIKGQSATKSEAQVRDRHYKDFVANGGETGYAHAQSLDRYKREMNRAIAELSGAKGNKIVGAAHALSAQFALYNRIIENMSRFTAYLTAIERGKSVTQSIDEAKEITLNFNTKGGVLTRQDGRVAEKNIYTTTSTLGRSLYMFYNVGINGLVRHGDLFKASPKRYLASKASNVALGALSQYILASLIDWVGDDEDKDNLKDLSSWDKRNNFLIWLGGGRFAKIPISMDTRPFYALGVESYRWASGETSHEEASDHIYTFASLASGMLPLDPLGAGANVLDNFIPTAINPLYEVVVNRSFTGAPIYKERMYNDITPAYRKVYNSTSLAAVEASKAWNSLLGGDKYHQGSAALDFNPAAVEHIVRGYWGGVGTFAMNLTQTTIGAVNAAITGDTQGLSVRTTPFVRVLATTVDDRKQGSYVRSKYRDYKRAASEVNIRMKGYEKELNTPSISDVDAAKYYKLLDELTFSSEYERASIINAYDEDINELNELIKELGDDDEATPSLKAEQIYIMQLAIDDYERASQQ